MPVDLDVEALGVGGFGRHQVSFGTVIGSPPAGPCARGRRAGRRACAARSARRSRRGSTGVRTVAAGPRRAPVRPGGPRVAVPVAVRGGPARPVAAGGAAAGDGGRGFGRFLPLDRGGASAPARRWSAAPGRRRGRVQPMPAWDAPAGTLAGEVAAWSSERATGLVRAGATVPAAGAREPRPELRRRRGDARARRRLPGRGAARPQHVGGPGDGPLDRRAPRGWPPGGPGRSAAPPPGAAAPTGRGRRSPPARGAAHVLGVGSACADRPAVSLPALRTASAGSACRGSTTRCRLPHSERTGAPASIGPRRWPGARPARRARAASPAARPSAPR